MTRTQYEILKQIAALPEEMSLKQIHSIKGNTNQALQRFVAAGYLEVSRTEPTGTSIPRKYYSLTAAGRDRVAEGWVEPVKNKKPRAECQICCREQALDKSGRMVNHGYKRPGYGFIIGNCFGVGYEPYPKTDALEAWKKELDRIEADKKAKLEEVERNEHEAVPVTEYEDYRHVTRWLRPELVAERNKLPRYSGSWYSWEALSEKYAESIRRDLRQITSVKNEVNKRIKEAKQ